MYGNNYQGDRQARVQMPAAQDMGGAQAPKWVRAPFYPTAPFYSTDPTVGYQTRFYSEGIVPGDADSAVNVEAIRTIQFDLPCRLIALTGASYDTVNYTNLSGIDPRDLFLFRLEYTQGDRLHVAQRLGSTVLGTMQNPGEIGGVGFTINRGAAAILGITPLIANLRIDITLVCLEMRGPSNYTRG